MRGRHPYAWGRDHPLVVDAVLAVLLAGLGIFTELVAPADPGLRDPDAFSVALSLGATLPLVLRRRLPLAVLLVVFGCSATHFVVEYPGAGPVFGLLVGLYGVAAYRSRRTAVLCLIPPVLLVGLGTLPAEGHSPEDRWGSLGVGALFVTAWVLGDNMRVRRAYVAAVEDRAAQLEREQDAQARRAVLEERARIARELHDVVAHGMSVMVVQAGAARRTLDRDRDRAVEAIGQIESTGRSALAEMRRLVGVLRGDLDRRPGGDGAPRPSADAAGGGQGGVPPGSPAGGDPSGIGQGQPSGGRDDPAVLGQVDDGPSLLPQPGLDQLAALVGQCRDAGLDVTLQVEGTERPLSSGIELVVYRIVQEALTNTLRHAGPAARADVDLRYGDSAVTVSVTDDGRGAAASGEPGGAVRATLVAAPEHGIVPLVLMGGGGAGTGHGLTGMHERVALYGGRIAAGPRAGGGFRVWAEVPLTDEPGAVPPEGGP